MSRDQLVNEYVEGNLSRRKFIHGLVGMGVGVAAAATFADVLAAKSARAVSGADLYDDPVDDNPDDGGDDLTPGPGDDLYPGPDEISDEPAISLSVPSAASGTSIGIIGQGFAPGSEATIDLYSDPIRLRTARIGGSGRFSETVTIPSGTPAGIHRIVVRGMSAKGGSIELSSNFEVLAPSGRPVAAQPKFTG